MKLEEIDICNRYENTEMRAKKLEDIGIMYMGMGVSGGEEGARNGTFMPDAGFVCVVLERGIPDPETILWHSYSIGILHTHALQALHICGSP